MKKNAIFIGFMILLFCLIAGCSTKKNTPVNRRYHAFTARFNTYFNGKLAFDQALLDQLHKEEENYTERIAMFPISTLPKEKSLVGGPFDIAIEKGTKAIKEHSIRKKPTRKSNWRTDPKQLAMQEKEEYNPFLKHCWLMVGQAQFYNADFLQAAATFSYIMRHYATDIEVVTEARVWQAQCYAEMNWLYEAESLFDNLKERGIPESNKKLHDRVYADYLIKKGEIEEAIPYLVNAVKTEKNKRQRLRMLYLLGQLYAEQGQNEAAYQAFGKVARANPPYSLEFAARIRQAEVFPGASYQVTLKRLNRMAKNVKNKEMLDQVYYAIGNVYISRQDTVNAIESYEKGVEESVQNGLNKAICQIRLGDIYFQQRDYVKAQPCFSGALAGIQKENREYERISRLSSVLDQLVVHVEAVHLQDSLQWLAKIPESERLAVIDEIIEEIKKREEEERALLAKEEYLAEQEGESGLGARQTMAVSPTIMAGGGEYSFYFYNPPVVEQGKTMFQKKWGKRALEDDWRRRNKHVDQFLALDEETIQEGAKMAFDEEGNPIETVDSLQLVMDSLSSDPLSRQYYLQQIPFSEDDLEASNVIIADGLFNMGMIYKDKLDNVSLMVELFEELERRFPENKYRLDYYYQSYLMALRFHEKELAEKYKNKLIANFPESDYTLALSDPNYEHRMRTMDAVQDSLYEQTYHHYLESDTAAVRHNVTFFISTYPLGTLIPKFMFLNALTYVQAGDAEGFKVALDSLVSKYPKADVSALATEMLKGILKGRTMVQGDFSGISWNLRFGLSDDGMLSLADTARSFVADSLMPHQLLLIYKTGSIDDNQLLYAVAAYNFSKFKVEYFDLSLVGFGGLSMLSVSGFDHVEEVADYYEKIYDPEGYGSTVDHAVAFFPVSQTNLETLMHGKTLEEYMLFFEEHFNTLFPHLVPRWKARLEEEHLLDSLKQRVEHEELLMEQEERSLDEQAVEVEERSEKAPHLDESILPHDTARVTRDTALSMTDTIVVIMADTVSAVTDTVEVMVADTTPAVQREVSLKEMEERTKALKLEEEKRKKEEQKALKERNKATEQARKQKAKERESARKEKTREAKERARQKGKTGKTKRERSKQATRDTVEQTIESIDLIPTDTVPSTDQMISLEALEERTKAAQSDKNRQIQEESKSLKERNKAAKKAQKLKEKEREQARKEKAREAKARMKQKEMERKAKASEYKRRQKEKSAEKKRRNKQ